MNELSDLDEINREDEQREDIKKEADAKQESKYFDDDDIRDEIMEVYHTFKRLGSTPKYLILDGQSYIKLLRVAAVGTIYEEYAFLKYAGMMICTVQQQKVDYHYVQVA